MTRSLLSSLVFLFAIPLVGQSPHVEVLDQLHPEVHYDGALPLDSAIVLLSWSDPGDLAWFPRRGLVYSTSGELLNSVELTTAWFNWSRSLVSAADGGAWLAGPIDGCDVFGGGRIMRYGPDGNLLLDHTYDPLELWGNISELSSIAQNPTERHAFFGYGVAIADTMGTILEYWDIPLAQIGGPASWYTDDQLITTGFSRMDIRVDAGAPLFTRNLSGSIADLQVNGDQIWILDNDTLFNLGTDLGTIDSIPLPSSELPRQFVKGGNGAYLQLGNTLYTYGSGQGITPVLEPSLQEGQRIHAFVVKDTMAYAIGDQRLNSYSAGSVNYYAGGVLQSHALSGTTSVHDEDVAVESVTLDSLWLVNYPPSLWAYQHGAVSVVVRNLGTEPLQDFMLAYRTGSVSITCGTSSEYLTVTGANIAPGDTATLSIADLLLWVGQLTPGQVIEHDVCITALGPNELMDRDIENNTACTPLLVELDITVGINEALRNVRVHPSPFTDHFVIDMVATGSTRLSLHDATGAVVLERSLNGPGPHIIPTSGLSSGIYVVALRSDEGIVRRKLLRE